MLVGHHRLLQTGHGAGTIRDGCSQRRCDTTGSCRGSRVIGHLSVENICAQLLHEGTVVLFRELRKGTRIHPVQRLVDECCVLAAVYLL